LNIPFKEFPMSLLKTFGPGESSGEAEKIYQSLSPLLMGLIRYLTAVALEMEPCVEYNARVLNVYGLTEEQVADLKVNPASAPLDEKDGWLLAFVIKAVRAPETISEGHIRKLRDLGWADADIFDGLYLSCMMVGTGTMMKALK
jgi:alkylhydroperoxidase family enzyme